MLKSQLKVKFFKISVYYIVKHEADTINII